MDDDIADTVNKVKSFSVRSWRELNELRDIFAAHALQGILACPDTTGSIQGFAEAAYGYADAMLKVRES